MDDLLKEPSASIKAARRQLESIQGYELLDDFVWNRDFNAWIIKVRLTCAVPENEFVPEMTEWHVAIGENYPDGIIKFYPDKTNGVKATFPHQNYNQETKHAFLSGDPCLNTQQGSWGRKAYSSEPTGLSRLVWHFHRCLNWLKAAASDALLQQDDPFELPAYPSLLPKCTIAFNEDHDSFQRWLPAIVNRGVIELKTLGQSPELYAVFNFLGHEQNAPETVWGKRIAGVKKEDQSGVWLLANEIPIQKPWQLPRKMGDLIKVLSMQGINLHERISHPYSKVRKSGREVRTIFIGFPVSEKIGHPNSLIHWLALELPNPPKSNGFRDTQALHNHEISILISPEKTIRWIQTENWNKYQLTRRGNIEKHLNSSNVVIVGCGAVGSILAEQLCRLGLEKITLVDSGTLDAGNMSRHVLTLTDVGNNKADALSKRLNSIFPFLNVNFEKHKIQDVVSSRPDFFDSFDLVIDATAIDAALKCISDLLSNTDKSFVSISTGYNANRLFCFVRKGVYDETIFDSFNKVCAPWLTAERELSASSPEVVDGVGCWHPLFPARLDDLLMLTGASVKIVESNLKKDSVNTLTIVEKQFDQENTFSGVKIIRQDS